MPTRRYDPVVAVVLAAGASARLGRPKQLLTVGGRTLVERAVRAARACDGTVVVVGAHAAQVRRAAEAASLPVTFALNDAWATGLASSIRAGLDAALAGHPDLAGVTFLACDQPFVDRAHVEMLLMAYRAGCAPIVASGHAHDGRAVVGVPALFGRSVLGELRGLSGDSGARSVIARDASRVAVVPASAGAIDVDTESDFHRASAMRATS